MSILSTVENEFNSIIADAKSVAEKLEDLVNLHGKVGVLKALEASISNVISNAETSVETKVEELLKIMGKL